LAALCIDDSFFSWEKTTMEGRAKAQIKSGLRVGGNLAAFMIAVVFLQIGLGRVAWASLHPPVWSDWVGWLLISAAGLLLLLSAHVWLFLLAGCALFALGKSMIVVITGKYMYSPHAAFPRLEAAEIGVLALITLVLMVRLAASSLTIIDRFALTFYVFTLALAWHGNANFSLANPWQLAGLGALIVSWCDHHFRKHSNSPATS
jgi:hypothetical protein